MSIEKDRVQQKQRMAQTGTDFGFRSNNLTGRRQTNQLGDGYERAALNSRPPDQFALNRTWTALQGQRRRDQW